MNDRTSRRTFVKRGLLAASALSGGLAIARGAHAGGGETIKVALIGCGGRGTGAAAQALSTAGPVKLWAMADLFADKLETSLAGLTKQLTKQYDHHFVEFTYADGSQLFSQCRHATGCWNSVAEHAVGAKGKADVGGGLIEAAGDTWRYRGAKVNPYQVEHDALLDAIRNDKPYNEAEYSAHSTMTGILGRMAVYSGKVVTWDEAINSKLCLAPDRYDWSATPPVLPGKDGLYPCAMPGVSKV